MTDKQTMFQTEFLKSFDLKLEEYQKFFTNMYIRLNIYEELNILIDDKITDIQRKRLAEERVKTSCVNIDNSRWHIQVLNQQHWNLFETFLNSNLQIFKSCFKKLMWFLKLTNGLTIKILLNQDNIFKFSSLVGEEHVSFLLNLVPDLSPFHKFVATFVNYVTELKYEMKLGELIQTQVKQFKNDLNIYVVTRQGSLTLLGLASLNWNVSVCKELLRFGHHIDVFKLCLESDQQLSPRQLNHKYLVMGVLKNCDYSCLKARAEIDILLESAELLQITSETLNVYFTCVPIITLVQSFL